MLRDRAVISSHEEKEEKAGRNAKAKIFGRPGRTKKKGKKTNRNKRIPSSPLREKERESARDGLSAH